MCRPWFGHDQKRLRQTKQDYLDRRCLHLRTHEWLLVPKRLRNHWLASRILSRLRYIVESSMTETEKRVREHLAKIGRRGGLASRRDLTRSHAKQMVAIREAKRAALKTSVR
jgi:hypothetical protein